MRKRIKSLIHTKHIIFLILLGLVFMDEAFEEIEAQEVQIENKDTLKWETDTLFEPIIGSDPTIARIAPNHSFGVGEEFVFKVRWGPISAGTATMSIPEIIDYKGKQCFRIVSTAESSKFFSTFFKVRDRVESYMAKEGLYSLHFEKHLREGKFKADRFVDFDQQKQIAIEGNDTIPVPPFVQDVLSAFYFVRTQNLEIGKSLFIDNHTDKKNYPLEVKVLRKERIEVEAGTFDCIVVEPILQASAIFKQKGGLTVWLTDDKVKMPVLMKSKVIIGSIATELKEYKLGKIEKN